MVSQVKAGQGARGNLRLRSHKNKRFKLILPLTLPKCQLDISDIISYMANNHEAPASLPELPKEIAKIWQSHCRAHEKDDKKARPFIGSDERKHDFDGERAYGELSLKRIITSANQETALNLLEAVEEQSLRTQTMLLAMCQTAISGTLLEPDAVVTILQTTVKASPEHWGYPLEKQKALLGAVCRNLGVP